MENIKEKLKAAYDRGAIDERKNRTNDRLLEEGAKAIEEQRTFDIYWEQLQSKGAWEKKFEKLNKADVIKSVCEHDWRVYDIEFEKCTKCKELRKRR